MPISLPCPEAVLVLIKITSGLLQEQLLGFCPWLLVSHTSSFFLAFASATDTFLGCPLQ